MKPDIGAGPSSDAAATQTGHGARSELRTGEVLAGRFRIEALVGIGGMGVVYRAFDLSLEIEVALKLLRPELARKPEAFRDFRQELLLARQVSSPHVVRIHDIAEHEGRWFISMDCIRGESLERLRDRLRKLPPERAVAITRGLLEGLVAAHQRGVVHRDLKPANILLGDGDHAYITDFGIARILGSTGMTQTGVVVGTPEYLSPEQARGQRVDARSDLYAVGLIFYEMLAGELPFSGGTPAEAVVQRILRPPPSLARARPDLPGWMHALSDRLLKVDPAHRFDSARAALQALDARRVPRPPLDRRRLAFAAAAVLAVAGLGGWIALHPDALARVFAAARTSTARVGIVPFASDASDASLAPIARVLEEQLRDAMRADASASVVLRRRLLDARARTVADLEGDALQRRLPDLANASGADRLVLARLSRDDSRGLVLELRWFATASDTRPEPLVVKGDTPDALHAAWRAAMPRWLRERGIGIDALPATAPDALVRTGEALLALDRGEPALALQALGARAPDPADVLALRVRFDAEDAARQSLAWQATRERVLAPTPVLEPGPAAATLRVRALMAGDDPAVARTALDQARSAWPNDPELALLDAQARADAGEGEAALALLHRYVQGDAQDARAWFLLGRSAILQGQAQPAVDDYLVRALVLHTRAGNAAAEAETRNALGIGYERLGQLDAASEQYARAAAMRERLGDREGLAKTLRNLAIVQAQRGERDEAEATLARVRGMLEELGDRASLADLHNDRGVIAEERGDFAAALAAYREALVLRQQLDVPDLVAESLNNVAYASLQLGEFDNALVYWQQAGALYQSVDDRNGLLRIDQNIGLLDIARGRFAEAGERLRASLRLATDRQLPEETSVAHVNLAELALAEGRHADALAHAASAREIATRRTDLRTQAEAGLLEARTACALGDAAAVEAALAALPTTLANREQDAIRLLADACRAELVGDRAGAAARLEAAHAAARDAHGGKLATQIRMRQARLALAGDGVGAAALLEEIRADEARLREVPLRLDWLAIEISAALRAGDRATAVRRYREALALSKGIDRLAGAALLHELGARALAGTPEADIAREAAARARERLFDDAPPGSRERLQALFERRLLEQGAPHAI
ncbi:MAG: serine/threonine-protein kinase [Lysobacteraceae bacterium]|nr:MAG: serine/threonine-protein kinase [Xanthomonadaceae bacterium]